MLPLSLLGGAVFHQELDDWSITWEADQQYRHWCFQQADPCWQNLLVVMFNPGSLADDGKNLRKDTTLRVLREVCSASMCNAAIVNLFDYATPSPNTLFSHWHRRDSHDLVFEYLPYHKFKRYIFAFGDFQNSSLHKQAIADRINLIRSHFSSLKQIHLLCNKSGTPMHPLAWQRQKLKQQIIELIRCSL